MYVCVIGNTSILLVSSKTFGLYDHCYFVVCNMFPQFTLLWNVDVREIVTLSLLNCHSAWSMWILVLLTCGNNAQVKKRLINKPSMFNLGIQYPLQPVFWYSLMHHVNNEHSGLLELCNNTSIHEWWGAGVVICLEQGADLHMAQLMPLPLTVSCFSKIQIGFTFLVPAHPGSPGKRAIKRVCVCVLVFILLLCRSTGYMMATHMYWIMYTQILLASVSRPCLTDCIPQYTVGDHMVVWVFWWEKHFHINLRFGRCLSATISLDSGEDVNINRIYVFTFLWHSFC